MKIKETLIFFIMNFCFLVLAFLFILLEPNRLWTINDLISSIAIK